MVEGDALTQVRPDTGATGPDCALLLAATGSAAQLRLATAVQVDQVQGTSADTYQSLGIVARARINGDVSLPEGTYLELARRSVPTASELRIARGGFAPELMESQAAQPVGIDVGAIYHLTLDLDGNNALGLLGDPRGPNAAVLFTLESAVGTQVGLHIRGLAGRFYYLGVIVGG